MTVFLGCGFAAKYLEGGGNFSVPLQWALGLKRLSVDFVWLELLPGTADPALDRKKIEHFTRQLRANGLSGKYCLLYQKTADDSHDLEKIECHGLSERRLRDRLNGPNILLNLSYSIHPPFLLQFERRVLCDLDPSEIFYWMTKVEMGQSFHHDFWTIGLNVGQPDCLLPMQQIDWRTFYPLADTDYFQPQPRPRTMKFATVGQWYWGGAVEVEGEFPDLSKKFAFEKYIDLPGRVRGAKFELAMNINPDDPERERLRARGWKVVDPHIVGSTPKRYRRYLARAAAEFTAIKGVDVSWRTGWLSDRAAAFCALGRPVITEDTGAGRFLPRESGLQFVGSLDEAEAAADAVMGDWKRWSAGARECAVELFDSSKNLSRILGL